MESATHKINLKGSMQVKKWYNLGDFTHYYSLKAVWTSVLHLLKKWGASEELNKARQMRSLRSSEREHKKGQLAFFASNFANVLTQT